MHQYSLNICALRQDTMFSGSGEDAGFIVWVYYEPHKEESLSKALSTIGVDIKNVERAAVHP